MSMCLRGAMYMAGTDRINCSKENSHLKDIILAILYYRTRSRWLDSTYAKRSHQQCRLTLTPLILVDHLLLLRHSHRFRRI